MAGIPWTDKEIDILRRMAKKGLTDKEIVKVLVGRTCSAITAQRSIQGLQQYNFPPKTEIDMQAFNRFMKGEK